MATISLSRKGKGDTSWRRWFRRSNVYIAEYILMLLLMAGFLGVVSGLWFSFFGMLLDDSYASRQMAVETAAQLGTLIVVGGAAFWMYARVTGQEMVEPTVLAKRSRTVFLTLWVLGVTLALVGVVSSTVSAVMSSFFNFGGDVEGKELWVGMVIPAVLVVLTLALGLGMVVKHMSRVLVIRAAWVVAVLAVVVFVANLVMVLVRKDIPAPTPAQTCNFSHYLNGDCSYSDYQMSSGQSSQSKPQDVTTQNELLKLQSLFE